MDYGFAGAVLALLFFFFGIFAGVGAGDILAKRCVTKGEYVRMNLLAFVAATLARTALIALDILMVEAIVIGCLGGVIAGLKMTFGESVGIWKFADKHFRTNKDHLRRAQNSERAEAVRRARRDGGPEPELISVQEDGPAGKPSGK